MKKTPLNKLSAKQKIENAERTKLHHLLFDEQEGKCKKCGRVLEYYQSELSHKIPLAHGGKTTRENCEVLCAWWLAGCHANDEHHRNNKYNEQPKWTREG